MRWIVGRGIEWRWVSDFESEGRERWNTGFRRESQTALTHFFLRRANPQGPTRDSFFLMPPQRRSYAALLRQRNVPLSERHVNSLRPCKVQHMNCAQTSPKILDHAVKERTLRVACGSGMLLAHFVQPAHPDLSSANSKLILSSTLNSVGSIECFSKIPSTDERAYIRRSPIGRSVVLVLYSNRLARKES
jgi:hypothetical protein